jgi:acetyl esterase/lipase
MRWRRRVGVGLLVVAVVLGILVAWEPTRVGLQTAVLLPNLLDAGPKPLTLFSAAPQRMPVPYREGVGASTEPELAELWLPAWASSEQRAGAMLLVLGVNNVGRNHPVVARVADGLARTGVAVLVPDSRVLLEGRLEVGEIDGVVRAFELLAARPEVDPERVGIVGFSVGGSLALLAAADPRIADDVAWVNAFGAFADASTYLAAVSAHAYRGPDGSDVPWTPSDLAREVYLRFMLDQVDDEADRRRLERAYGPAILAGERSTAEPDLRADLETDAARAIHDLLTARSLEDAEATIERLDDTSGAFIDAISPVRHLGGLEADVHLMHETEDHHVPFVESRALADALRSTGLLEAHTEFRLFDHVQPDDVDLLAAAPELVKLLLHVRALMEETL